MSTTEQRLADYSRDGAILSSLTVITPSIPSRAHFLTECRASVKAQTVQPFAHLVRQDDPGERDRSGKEDHMVEQHNALLAMVETEWLAVLHDDDTYLPHHLETILPALDDADVVYTFSTTPQVSRQDVTGWGQCQLVEALERSNILPACAAIRTEVEIEVGGWQHVDKALFSDWSNWLRLAKAGAKFVCVPVPTWSYRFHEGQTCG